MNRILILEDSPFRVYLFEKIFRDSDLYITNSVSEAKELNNEWGSFDYYFLDHDLDRKIFVSSENENSGYNFVRYLVKRDCKSSKIFIHSFNPFGAFKMKNLLKLNGINSKFRPFYVCCLLFKKVSGHVD